MTCGACAVINGSADVATLATKLGRNPTDAKRLRRELRAYYEPDGGRTGWPMLRSPFVYQVPFYSWRMANALFRVKSAAYRKAYAAGDYARALAIVEPPYRLSFLDAWLRPATSLVLTPTEIGALLGSAWLQTELIYPNGYRKLVRLFQRAGFTTDVEPDESGREFLLPFGESVLYRGVDPKGKRGMSWTRSAATAAWFAGRYGQRGTVYETTVSNADILAVFISRGEDEAVVDPAKLGAIRVCERRIAQVRRDRFDD